MLLLLLLLLTWFVALYDHVAGLRYFLSFALVGVVIARVKAFQHSHAFLGPCESAHGEQKNVSRKKEEFSFYLRQCRKLGNLFVCSLSSSCSSTAGKGFDLFSGVWLK